MRALNKMRRAFEAKHPIPDFVIWNPIHKRYERAAFVASTGRNEYRKLWEEFQETYRPEEHGCPKREEFEDAYIEEMVTSYGESYRERAEGNCAWFREDGDYQDPMLRLAYWAWSASRAALLTGSDEVEQPWL